MRPAPEGYVWITSVNETKDEIMHAESIFECMKNQAEVFECLTGETSHCRHWIEECQIELIDIDHDAGDFAVDGGDYIKLLDWLEETGRNYPIRIHSMNPVGVANMRAIIERNGWKEIR